MREFILPETNQTRRMKEICLCSSYTCGGDIHKLLSYEILHRLVKKIPLGEIKISSDLVYGRDTITKEEKFIENLDKYIGYVRDNYYIQHSEQLLIIEATLQNNYSKILYSLNDYHQKDGHLEYIDSFRKMFLFNMCDNAKFFDKLVDKNSFIHRFVEYINNYNFEDEGDILKIENTVKKMINNRKNNLYRIFVPRKLIKKSEYNFYICLLESFLAEFYEKNKIEEFEVDNSSHYINVSNGGILVLDVTSSLNQLENKEDIFINFGIQNQFFSAMVLNIRIRQNEWKKLIKMLKKGSMDKRINDDLMFNDPTLKFKLWDANDMQWLDISFEFGESYDTYVISLRPEEIKNLYSILVSQT